MEHKEYLPRMGAPVCHVSVSEDNSIYVSSHLDNCKYGRSLLRELLVRLATYNVFMYVTGNNHRRGDTQTALLILF